MSQEEPFRKLERMHAPGPIKASFRPALRVGHGEAEMRIPLRPDFHHPAGVSGTLLGSSPPQTSGRHRSPARLPSVDDLAEMDPGPAHRDGARHRVHERVPGPTRDGRRLQRRPLRPVVQDFRDFFFRLAPGGDEAALRAFALKTVTFVVGQVREALGTTPVYFTLGNWDDYAGSFGLQPDDPFLADTSALFRDGFLAGAAGSPDFDATYRSGGYYAAEVPGTGLVVLGLNTLFLAPHAPAGIEAAVTRELDWLAATLTSFRASGRLAWIVMHVPPGGDLATTGSHVTPDGQVDQVTMLLQPDPQQRLLGILETHRDVVTGVFTGHTHMDEYRIAASAMQGIPGITSDMGNAPAFKTFTVSAGGVLEDYVSWWLDLGDPSAPFQPYYDFSPAYALPPPLGPSQAALAPRLAATGTAQAGYRRRYGSGHAPNTPITDLNWAVYRCGITVMDGPGLQRCANGGP